MKQGTAKGRREAERQRRARRLRRRRLLRLVAVVAALLAGVAIIALGFGGSPASSGSVRSWPWAARNFARAQLAAAPVDSLRIDIKFKHLHRIHTKRDEALARGVLIAERDDFVPASIALAGAGVPVRLRLVGPEPAHLRRDPWSFEIRVQGDAHVNGMRRFVLHAPRVAGGALPLVAATQLERAGLVAPRTSLVEVAINGDELGLAVLFELPSPELLRARGHGAAPVVRFEPGDYWEARGDNERPGPFDNPFTALIVAEPDKGDAATATAIGLLRAFLDGTLPAGQVFDLDAAARWLASAEFWGDPTCVHWTQARFFLDPLTAKLAPIPQLPKRRHPPQQDPSRPRGELIASLGELGARLLADEELRHRFAFELRSLSNELGASSGPGSLLDTLEQRQHEVLLRVHRFAPFARPVRLLDRAQRIASLSAIDSRRDTWFAPSLARGELSLPGVVSARARSDEEGAYLDLHNLLPIPVAVSTLRHDDGDGREATPVTLASRVTFPIRLEPTPVGRPAVPVRVRYRQPNVAAVPEAIRGIAHIAGDEREYEFVARVSPPPLLAHPIPTAGIEEVLVQHPFLRKEPGDLALHTQPGSFEVEGSLVMPPATALVIEAGTELVFGARDALITGARLDLRGTAEDPVVLRGADGRRGRRWQGLALLRSSRPSIWSHAQIHDTTGVERKGWRLAAGVTVRRATLQLDAVRVARSRADAAVSVVDSQLDAAGLSIEASAGTALVLRGGSARLQGVSLAETGRDGLSASGASVRLNGGSLRAIRATALEAADGSEVVAEGLEIDGASIAAAAKNGARLSLEHSQIRAIAHVPFLAFTDRVELGGGQIRASGNQIASLGETDERQGAARIAIAERGSSVIVDGVATAPVDAAIGGLRID